jgi:hypothetical protein
VRALHSDSSLGILFLVGAVESIPQFTDFDGQFFNGAVCYGLRLRARARRDSRRFSDSSGHWLYLSTGVRAGAEGDTSLRFAFMISYILWQSQ